MNITTRLTSTQKLITRILLVMAGILLGYTILTITAPNAYAAPCPVWNPVCQGTGGGNGGSPGPGDSGAGATPPVDRSQNVPTRASVEVPCNQWNTGGTSYQWKKSSTCTVFNAGLKGAITSSSSNATLPPNGSYRFILDGRVIDGGYAGNKDVPLVGTTTCSSAFLSAYSKNFRYDITRVYTTRTTYNWISVFYWDALQAGQNLGVPAWNGQNTWTRVGGQIHYNMVDHITWTNQFTINANSAGCNYPAANIARQFYCFYEYGGQAYWSQDKNAIGTGGTLSKTRANLSSDPNPPNWNGNVASAPSCDNTSENGGLASLYVSINPDDPNDGGATTNHGYSYYRLMPWYKQRQFTLTNYTTRAGSVVPARVFYSAWSSNYSNNTSPPRLYATGWWAYSCYAGLEGRYGSSGALPNRNAYFGVGDCPNVVPRWQCTFSDPTTVAMDRTGIAAGTTYVGSKTTVMRNGEQVPVTFSTIRIIDTTSGTVDVTNGAAGGSIRDVTNIAYRSLVKAGSTPFAGSDPNSSSQLFRLWTGYKSSTNESWGSWQNNANSNLTKGLSFNWATVDNTGSFVAQRQWRVSAEFYVLRSGGILVGGPTGSTTPSPVYEWVGDTQICYEKNASGMSTGNILTAESNPVVVVRAVNTPVNNG